MKISLLLFLYTLHEINCIENGSNLMKYLDERAKIVGEKLIRHARNQEISYAVKLTNLNNMELTGNYSSGEIFIFFNTPYVLIHQNLYKISQNNYSLIHQFVGLEDVQIIQTTEYKKLGFIAMASKNSDVLHIFGFSRDKIFKIQNIVHQNIIQTAFFQCQSNLYLLISESLSQDLTSIGIYKFLESHFDETERFFAPSTTKIHTFRNNESEIIIVLQKLVPSTLYEFQNDQIKKIQKIDTKNPTDVVNYMYQGKQYVLIFNERNDIERYFWTGSDLLFWENFNSENVFKHKKVLFYVNKDPYLLLSQNNTILIFTVANNQFSLIHSFELNTNWTEIWTYEFLPLNNSLLTLTSSVDEKLQISEFSLSIVRNLSDQKVEEEEETLSKCFTSLEKAVYSLRSKLTDLENTSESILGQVPEHKSLNSLPLKELETLQTRYSKIQDAIENLQSNTLVINDTVKFTKPIRAKKVIGKDIRFEKLNNQKWQPEKWLSYSVPQKITGPVNVKVMKTKALETDKNDTLFKDLLLSNGHQILHGSLTVNNLESTQIETDSINNIPVDDFYYKSKPTQIEGLKIFPELEARSLKTASINGMDGNEIVKFLTSNSDSTYNFDTDVKVDNLWVENINGINFDEFKNSVFRIGLVNTIEGNLTFSTLKAKNMIFDKLANHTSVLTTSTDQVINSTIIIPKIFTQNIKTNTINGIDFKNSVATFNNSEIIGPVSIKALNVKNDLSLNGTINDEFLQFNDTHIVGTNVTDFLQRYSGKVKIKGDLILKNLDVQKSAKIEIFGREFEPNFHEFWTKSTQQEIPTHFEAQNGISTPHLNTIFVNDVYVDDYMLNSTQQKKKAKFYFENVTIKGNVLLNPDEQHSPDLAQIEEKSVKVNGTFVIKGQKTYTNILKGEKLELNRFNNDSLSDGNDSTNSLGPKKIRSLVIKGDLNVDDLIVENINGINLEELKKNTIYIDQPQNISDLNFESVTVQNLFITSLLNDQDIDELMLKLDKINDISKIDKVYVNGNVTIEDVQDLESINNLSVEQLMKASHSQYHDGKVFSNVHFLGHVKVKDFYVLRVNNIDLEKLSLRTLYRSWSQTIKEHFTFTKLKTENLIADQINEYNIKNLIDISSNKPQRLFVSNGLTIRGPVKIRNLFANFGCDIHEVFRNLRSPPTQFWENVKVLGNVTFWDKDSTLGRIFDKIVTIHSDNRVIEGKVTFSNHISANNVEAMKKINDVDLMEIVEDAFLNREDTEQIVTGKKTFSTFKAEDLISLENLNVSTINGINVSEIDKKIIYKDSIPDVPIKGKKVFFGGLQATRLETNLISGVQPDNIVSFENPREIPNAIFESISVEENFNIKFVNNMPFDVLLNERLLKKSPVEQVLTGNYFFRDVKFEGNISTAQINDIKMENVVYDEGIQTIESSKRFLEDFKITGDMKVDLINGLDLSKIYEQSVLKNEDTNFKGSVIFVKPTVMKGNIQTRYFNNVSVDTMLDINAKHSLNSEKEQIENITKTISDFVHEYLNVTIRMPTELLYLEKSTDLQISVPNTIDADVVETKEDILIHIESEEDGIFCGLPANCKCPVQQTMQISSEHSVNMFINKASQRIYSYSDDDIIAHVISHSISTNSKCRTSKTKVMNEVSVLRWNKFPRENSTGGFFEHNAFFSGYISGVKFFTIYGKTYVVVGIYYDPVLDSHEVNSLVLRFNDDKTQVEEVQKIPSGVKTISLIPTAQGIILITGNDKSDQINNTSTKIYRFDYQKEQFNLLREVQSFACHFAQGVVLETNSLIVLANEDSTLHILKYQPEFDNYYFYQHFQLEHPVSSLSVFYTEGFGISDAYLSVVTKNNGYFIYSFQFIEGWKLESSGIIDGITALVPFKLNKKSYLFAPSSKISSLFTLVEHDSD